MDFIMKIVGFLNGKKTYLVAFGLIAQVVWPFFQGNITLADVFAGDKLQQILEGLGLATLRLGVKKSGPTT